MSMLFLVMRLSYTMGFNSYMPLAVAVVYRLMFSGIKNKIAASVEIIKTRENFTERQKDYEQTFWIIGKR